MNDTNTPENHKKSRQIHLSSQTRIILVLSMLALLFALGSQHSENVTGNQQITGTPQAIHSITPVPATPTEVFEKDSEYTTGLIYGAIFLLLIIIIGTLTIIGYKSKTK